MNSANSDQMTNIQPVLHLLLTDGNKTFGRDGIFLSDILLNTFSSVLYIVTKGVNIFKLVVLSARFGKENISNWPYQTKYLR